MCTNTGNPKHALPLSEMLLSSLSFLPDGKSMHALTEACFTCNYVSVKKSKWWW